MTEYREKLRKKRGVLLGSVIALALVIEAVLAITMGNRQVRTEQAALAAEQQAAAEATLPPAPLTLEALLGVSASDWSLRLVRSDTPLAPDFVPELEEIERGELFDARAAAALRIMIAEARADGYPVYVCSGYRAYETQYAIYQNHINTYEAQGMTPDEARAATLLAVNYPGGSEHQLGLAADLLESEDQAMEPWIGGSGLMLWLQEHCAEYGFIVRYPDGKTDVTGVEYEPWHLRYVGASAPYIMENDLCLEEFLAQLG